MLRHRPFEAGRHLSGVPPLVYRRAGGSHVIQRPKRSGIDQFVVGVSGQERSISRADLSGENIHVQFVGVRPPANTGNDCRGLRVSWIVCLVAFVDRAFALRKSRRMCSVSREP